MAAGLWAGAAAEPGVQLGPLLPHPWGSLSDVGHEDGVAKADGLTVRAQRDFPSPTPTFLRPSVSCSPQCGREEERGEEGPRQPAQGERGRSRRVGAGWLRRQDLSRKSLGWTVSHPLFYPAPLSSPVRFLPPTTLTSKLHPASSPSAPHFLLSFLSWAQKAVGVPKPRVGEGAGGDGSEPLPQLHQARTSPLPQSLIHGLIIFMSLMNTQYSHYGAGVSLSRSSFCPSLRLPGEAAAMEGGEEGTPDVQPDEGGGGTGGRQAAAVTAVPRWRRGGDPVRGN